MARQKAPTADEMHLYMKADEALQMAKEKGMGTTTLSTLLRWVDKHKLGFQPGGNCSRWYIHRDKFTRFINGENIDTE